MSKNSKATYISIYLEVGFACNAWWNSGAGAVID